MTDPWTHISGNIDDANVATGQPLLLGTKSNLHYQSLLPIEGQLFENFGQAENVFNLKRCAEAEESIKKKLKAGENEKTEERRNILVTDQNEIQLPEKEDEKEMDNENQEGSVTFNNKGTLIKRNIDIGGNVKCFFSAIDL